MHRIGRTGRADATGDAFSLVDPSEEQMVKAIERVIGKPLPRVTLPNFNYHKAAQHQPQQQQHHSRHRRPFR